MQTTTKLGLAALMAATVAGTAMDFNLAAEHLGAKVHADVAVDRQPAGFHQ